MLVKNQKIEVKWNKQNRKHYEDLGYVFTKTGDSFYVSPEELTNGSHAIIEVECDYCGKIVKPKWKDYLKSKGDTYSCQSCRQKKTRDKTLEQRQDHLYNMALETCNKSGYKLITPKTQIKNACTRVEYECPIHGVRETKIYTLGLGYGCLECGYEISKEKSTLSQEEVEQRIEDCGGAWINKGEYTGWRDKNLIIQCPLCSKPFITSLNSYTCHGIQFCPECSDTESNGEKCVQEYLDDNSISYIQQYRFEDCRDKYSLPFDFFLPDLNTTIEFQGAQHYKAVDCFNGEEGYELRKKHDSIKREYCKSNNIYLIEIPYWELKNINQYLDERIIA